MSRSHLLAALVVVVSGAAGCLDLSEDGKVFACPDCVDAGLPAAPAVCACEVPAARCEGAVRISAAASRCLEDGGCEDVLVETACPSGCAEGRCIGEPCLGTVCGQPPAARCESPTALRVFTTPGACQAGGCLYASAEVSCDCEAGRCKQNPCAGVTCDSPPGASCAGDGLRTYQSPGTCDAATGRCAYALAQVACGASGCAAGRCADDACAGVVCNQPPAATCVGSSTLQTSQTPGTCSETSGACSYGTQLTTCPAGQQCSQGACVPVSASCNASNCAGCCEAGVCVLPSSQSGARCGAAGLSCGACGANAPACEAGTCVDRCAAVACTQPPASTCANATTRTVYSAGTCDKATGACSYAPMQVGCGAGNTCAGGVCSCVSESDAALCARLGKNCGTVASNDNCGVPRTVQCGSCGGGQSCVNAVCSCTAESDPAFCARLGKSCGLVSGTDSCGAPRVAACGTCAAGLTCGATNVCACAATETDAAFCARLAKNCGTVSGIDTCGVPRLASCGSCPTGQACGATNVCACVPESDAAACARLGAQCGALQATDNCGAPRTFSCGGCSAPNSCDASHLCSCAAESDAAFCSRLGKNCGPVTGTDSCNLPRTATCGSCTLPQSCGGGGTANVCGSARLVFSTAWQTLPNTGAQLVEFLCAGTVTTSAAGGTRCTASSGNPVRLRINGAAFDFYPGCDGNRPSNCMTSVTPSGATYATWGLLSGGKLLCNAMGWPLANALSDNNPGTLARPVAVVQTAPAVIGTAPDLKNYATYVGCEP